MRNQTSLSELFTRYINNQCSPQEIELLLQHFDATEDESLLKALIRERLEADQETEEALNPVLHHAFISIKEQIHQHNSENIPVISFAGRSWKRYAAAAAIIIAIGSSAWFWFMGPAKLEDIKTASIHEELDISPGANRATLTLANGQVIMLDSAEDGSLASQGGIKIIKLSDGQLAYQGASSGSMSSSTELYNTISTPKGGQYQIVLPDGSSVWLNAASSIRFPTSFTGDSRMVELSGEAYFEIAPDTKRPFSVKHGLTEVEVLGTSFNMNAYADEEFIRTTLLAGSVKVASQESDKSVVLKPGQQASVDQRENKVANPGIGVKQVDTDDAVAWKNGMFVFNDADIKSIIRQLSRWYDVDIHFEGKLPVDKFVGEVPRNSKLSEVLKIMELNNIHSKITGKTITLLP